MPIVFEEVTGEIAPERGATHDEPSATSSPGEEIAETVRHEMSLLQQRERRLRAD
jgi:hypothetical protein